MQSDIGLKALCSNDSVALTQILEIPLSEIRDCVKGKRDLFTYLRTSSEV